MANQVNRLKYINRQLRRKTELLEEKIENRDRLWKVCENFIKKHELCLEDVCEDKVFVNAPNLVVDVIGIIGEYDKLN